MVVHFFMGGKPYQRSAAVPEEDNRGRCRMRKFVVYSLLAMTPSVFAQSSQTDSTMKTEKAQKVKKKGKGAASEVAGGVGSAAGGAAKGAADLVTLHPIDAGAAVGTGAVKGAKGVTVGTAKGVGHVLKKIF